MRTPPNVSRRCPTLSESETSMEGGVRTPPNVRSHSLDRPHPVTSMEGGVRTPPNRPICSSVRSACRLQWRAACARRRIAAQSSAWAWRSALQWRAACARRRMPDWMLHSVDHVPLQWRAACARRRMRRGCRGSRRPPGHFNGGRRAHAAESVRASSARQAVCSLQWRAACARRRMSAGMLVTFFGVQLQWRAACARRRICRSRARCGPGRVDFNGGRRAHAAEWRLPARPLPLGGLTSMEGGVRTPPNARPIRRRPANRTDFNGGRRAHAAELALGALGLLAAYALQWRAACARRRIGHSCGSRSRWARLQWRAACARRRIRPGRCRVGWVPGDFNGGRRAHAAESAATANDNATAIGTSMEGGVRTPPNHTVPPRSPGLARTSMEGGVRTPPNTPVGRPRPRCPPTSMEGGVRTPPNASMQSRLWRLALLLQWRAACARRRIRVAAGDDDAVGSTSMEGGVRTPPNPYRCRSCRQYFSLQWRAACARRRICSLCLGGLHDVILQWRAACARRRMRGQPRRPRPRRPTSMEGGVRTPPNDVAVVVEQVGATTSMEGGVRTPPNSCLGGGHEYIVHTSMEGGVRTPPNTQRMETT